MSRQPHPIPAVEATLLELNSLSELDFEARLGVIELEASMGDAVAQATVDAVDAVVESAGTFDLEV